MNDFLAEFPVPWGAGGVVKMMHGDGLGGIHLT